MYVRMDENKCIHSVQFIGIVIMLSTCYDLMLLHQWQSVLTWVNIAKLHQTVSQMTKCKAKQIIFQATASQNK